MACARYYRINVHNFVKRECTATLQQTHSCRPHIQRIALTSEEKFFMSGKRCKRVTNSTARGVRTRCPPAVRLRKDKLNSHLESLRNQRGMRNRNIVIEVRENDITDNTEIPSNIKPPGLFQRAANTVHQNRKKHVRA